MDAADHPFNVDQDICRAATLPGSFYQDRAVWDAARESVFARSWQFAADGADVSQPGSVLPLVFLDGFLSEPLLFTRDEDDQVHCLSNVCTHRANLVVNGPGRERSLRCCYHGRRFGLDGRFISMPGFQGACDFPTKADDLAQVPHGVFGPLFFAALDPAVDFSEWIEPVRQRVGWMPLEEFRFEPSLSRDYLVRAHWALYCDNYLEGFHIPFVHPGLSAALDMEAYHTELFDWGSLQVGVAKGSEDCFELPASSPDAGHEIAAYYFWLFPNTMLNFYPWGLSLNVVRPVEPGLTRVSFRAYVWRPERLAGGAGADLDRVEREDEAVVESVQRGLRSRFYDRGRFSPQHEKGVHHFHRLLARTLTPH